MNKIEQAQAQLDSLKNELDNEYKAASTGQMLTRDEIQRDIEAMEAEWDKLTNKVADGVSLNRTELERYNSLPFMIGTLRRVLNGIPYK